jgi:pyruvate dehydrogenase E1 component alpha subunit
MLLARCFEEAVSRSYREGNLPGFVHLYIGQEAVVAGVSAHLQRTDYVATTHRGHPSFLAKGVPARELMAELWGRQTGLCGGRGGSMHLYALEYGMLGNQGVVGSGIPHAVGAAFSAQYRGTSQVAVSFFGDGAANVGSFHEGLNLASIWKLPIVFVCENNLYGLETPFQRATAGHDIAARAANYALPGFQVDGQDVLAVYEAAGAAVDRARSGGGPTLIECRTYRYHGHHEGDPGSSYRTPEEVAQWRQRDPILLFRNRLLEHGFAPDDLDRMEREVEALIQDAVQFAAASPWPPAASATIGVFATPLRTGGA